MYLNVSSETYYILTMGPPHTLGILLVLGLLASASAQIPTGCYYTSGVFECDYRFALPLTLADFDPQPQRLTIYNIDGDMQQSDFNNFNLINETQFDANYDASLQLTCMAGGGIMGISSASGSFQNFDVYKNVQITNCRIQNLPSSAFSNFGDLNYFGISGGQLDVVNSGALDGFVVKQDSASVDPKGELSLVDIDFPSNTFPTGFLTAQVSVSKLVLDGVDIAAVPVDLISLMPNLTSLNLDNNGFYELPEGMFTGVTGLSVLSFENVGWHCSCTSLWWLTYIQENAMIISSETICSTPTSGTRVASYYVDVCDAGLNCDGGSLPAMNLAGVTCLTYLQVVIYGLAIIGFVGSSLALGCWLHTKRQIDRMDPGGPAPRKNNRVSNNRGGGGRGGRREPPPGIRGGWA